MTREQAIRDDFMRGMSFRAIARKYGITRAQVEDIIRWWSRPEWRPRPRVEDARP